MSRVVRSIARVAAPILGGAVAGPIGAGIGGALGGGLGGGGLRGALIGGLGEFVGGGSIGRFADGGGLGTMAGANPLSSGLRTAGRAIGGLGQALMPSGGGIGGALGGGLGGGGLRGALIGGLGGFAGGGGFGTMAGTPLAGGAHGPTQGSGLLGALTRGANPVSRGLLTAGRAIGGLGQALMPSGGGGVGGGIAPMAGQIFSGIQGMRAYKDMERAQQAANQRALQTMSPFTSAGQAAQGRLSSLLGLSGENDPEILDQLRQSPGYQFRLDQGQQALDRSLAARGGLLSGRALQQTQQLGQGLADQTYNDYINSLMQQTGMGMGAAGQTANLQTVGGDITAASRLGRQDQLDRMLAGLLSPQGGY